MCFKSLLAFLLPHSVLQVHIDASLQDAGEPPSNPSTMLEQSTTMPRAQSYPSELATEHLLCTSCKDAVAACSALQSREKPPRGKSRLCSYIDRKTLESGATMGPTRDSHCVEPCHLCSLILGRIRQAEFWRQPPEDPPPAPEPIDVYFTVGRTGGTTLEVEIGESGRQRSVGYLVVVPADHEEAMSVSDTPDNPFFTLSATSSEGTTDVPRNARLAKSLASEASFSLAREWLKQCLASHARCTEATGLAVGRPYRLVDVGNDNSVDPKIIVMDFSRPVPPYLTLSHCWGGAKILRLLLGNIDILRKGIPMHELPKTFQDAVVITRRLGSVLASFQSTLAAGSH